MQLNSRIASIDGYPFKRLAALMNGIVPEVAKTVLLTLGEPQLPTPALAADAVAAHARLWNRYPPAAGTPEFRQAVARWLTARYGLTADAIDADGHIVPCSGTREGLFLVGIAAIDITRSGARPAVLMPNPFYHVYETAARIAGAEPVFLASGASTDDLPDIDAIDPALLQRTALVYLCSPSNPQGSVASLVTLRRWVALARRYDFVLALDECYAEIWLDAPPPGGLAAAVAEGPGETGDRFDQIVVLHSLSKRSSAAGLRSGFLAGDRRIVAAVTQLVASAGVPTPLPILAAATALWSDEAHVVPIRAAYRANFDAATALFTARGWRRPGGGFFLWLPVSDGEAVAQRVWRRAGIQVMPGAYMAAGRGTANPGHGFVRCALVHPPEITVPALHRMAEALAQIDPHPPAVAAPAAAHQDPR